LWAVESPAMYRSVPVAVLLMPAGATTTAAVIDRACETTTGSYCEQLFITVDGLPRLTEMKSLKRGRWKWGRRTDRRTRCNNSAS